MQNERIEGVVIKDLVTHGDERGFFREMLRANVDFSPVQAGQISHSLVKAGVLKAWHYHKKQSQWNYVATGEAWVVLYDQRQGSATFGNKIEMHFGEGLQPQAYFFPAGVLHGYKCLKGPMHIFYMTSGVYDPAEEGRLAADQGDAAYDWNNAPKVK